MIMVEIRKMIIPVSRARSGIKRTGLVGITIHNTGNYSKGAGALNHAKYLAGGGKNNQVSWHFAVDDKLITQTIPLDEVAWHAGDGGGNGNYKTIAIEICVNPDSNLTTACNNAAQLVAHLLKDYNLNINQVYQHNHWSGKNCPSELRRGKPYSWQDFLNKVKSYGSLSPSPAPSGKLYRVQVGAYSVRANAEAMLKKLKGAGFDGYIK